MNQLPARSKVVVTRRSGVRSAVILSLALGAPGAALAGSGASSNRVAGSDSRHKIGVLKLRHSAAFPEARGRLTLFSRVSSSRAVSFEIVARGLPATSTDDSAPDAYGVWLVGGAHDHFLGFAPGVTKKGRLEVSGPRSSDAKDFRRWLTHASRLLVTRETADQPKRPGQPVLRGRLRKVT